MTRDQGREWQRTPAPWWLPQLVLPITWFVAIVMSTAGPHVQCHDDPAACADDGFVSTLLASSVLATPLVLCLAPIAGLLLGTVWGALWLVPSDSGTGGFPALTVHGIACLITLGLMLVDRQRQRRLVPEPALSPVPARPQLRPPTRLWVTPAVVGGVTLTLAGILVAGYAHFRTAYDDYLERSTVVEGEVTHWDWDFERIVEVTLPGGDVWTFETEDTYEVGDPARVRLDPDRAELADEPTDLSYFLFPAGVLLLVACVMAGRVARFRRFLGRLRSGQVREHPVLLGLHTRDVYLHGHPPENTPPGRAFAVLPVASVVTPAEPGAVSPASPVTRETLTPGLYIGDLTAGDWGVVIAEGQVRWPRRPVRRPRRAPWNRSDRPTPSTHTMGWAPPAQPSRWH